MSVLPANYHQINIVVRRLVICIIILHELSPNEYVTVAIHCPLCTAIAKVYQNGTLALIHPKQDAHYSAHQFCRDLVPIRQSSHSALFNYLSIHARH